MNRNFFSLFIHYVICMNVDYIEYPKKGAFANFQFFPAHTLPPNFVSSSLDVFLQNKCFCSDEYNTYNR